MKWSDRIISAINSINPAFLIIIVLSIYYLGNILDGNEEQYLGYARWFSDPSWMAGSDVFDDFPGSRILFQWITGFFLKHFPFEQVAFWGRFCSFILVAFPLAGILRLAGISNIAFLLWFPVFYLPQQSFFAGEWIFGPLESKTISYAFVLASLYFLLKEKCWPAVLLGTVAVYWHLLAGGWWMFYLFLYLFVNRTNWKKIVLMAGVFFVLFVPLLIYLYSGLVKDNSPSVQGINTNAIYVFFRNPHHIGLFKSIPYFFHRHFPRVAVTLGVFIFVVVIRRKFKTGLLPRLNLLLIIILAQVFISLGLALFDKQGFFLKYYPFRGNGLAMLLFQMEMLLIITEYLRKKKEASVARVMRNSIFALLAVVVSYAYILYDRVEKRKTDRKHALVAESIAKDLKKMTGENEKFLLLCEAPDNILSIPRLSERPPFVVYRFVPTRSDRIYAWYMKVLKLEQVRNDPSLLLKDSSLAEIRAVVTCTAMEESFLKLVSQNEYLYLYRVERDIRKQ